MRTVRVILVTLAFGLLTALAAPAQAADTADDRTPPRLSFADGQVSFWRPGAQDWAEAQVNTPLAPGDELFTGSPGNLELQIGSRAFVRGWANTQIGLANQEPGYLQFKVTTGSASFDLRTLEPGTTVEVATPNAVLTIEHAGYYRVDVSGERTSFVTRRGGQATVTPATGEAVAITPSEEVVIEGTSSPRVSSYVAPPRDDWDKWNYARSDTHLDTMSARYVSPGTYGVSELDRYGTWRAVPDYGSVWIPTAVPRGWAPYTTGSWTLDPTYGWTWVDTAPWGWAPYHHGRWVSVNGYWAWAPGPVVARPVYAPALVAFFGGPSLRVGISIGGPVLGWVALGWGEPLVPWWGRPGFIRTPSWGGWGGPRVVNNVVINNTTVVNVTNINVYRNSSVQNAVVVVNESRFGRGPITSARVTTVDVKSLQPTHAAPQIAATPASFVPTDRRGVRPPEASLKRSVVVTRPPHAAPEPAAGGERKAGPPGAPAPAPRIVSAPSRHEADAVPARPPLGQSKVERRSPDSATPLSPPKPPERGQAAPPPREPKVATPSRSAPSSSAAPAVPATAPPAPARQPEKPEKAEKAEKPEKPQVAAPAPSAPPAPGRRPEQPQVAAPSTSVPQSPAARATAPPPPARQPEKPEKPQVAAPSPSAAPAPGRRPEQPQVAAPAPSAPPAPPARATAPSPPARQAEKPQEKKAQEKEKPQVAAPSARQPLPGEPANRVSPYRAPKETKDAKEKQGG